MRFAAEQLSGPYISAAGRFKVRPAICENIQICRIDSCDRAASYDFNQSRAFRCLLKSIPKLKASSKTKLQRNEVLERKSESCTGPSYQQRRFKLYSFPSFGIQSATGSMRSPANAVYSKILCPSSQRRPKEGLFPPLTKLRSRIAGSIFPVKSLSSSNPDPVSNDPPSKDAASTATRDLETAKSTLASRVGQSVNMRGVGVFLKLVFGGDSHLAVPHISVPDIR